MGIRKRPTKGQVVFIYLAGIGILIFFMPFVIFYFNRCETIGIVERIELPKTYVKFNDTKDVEYVVTTEEEYRKSDLIVGREVQVHYKKDFPTDAHLPDFEGNRPYLIYLILVLMAFASVFIMQRDYIKLK